MSIFFRDSKYYILLNFLKHLFSKKFTIECSHDTPAIQILYQKPTTYQSIQSTRIICKMWQLGSSKSDSQQRLRILTHVTTWKTHNKISLQHLNNPSWVWTLLLIHTIHPLELEHPSFYWGIFPLIQQPIGFEHNCPNIYPLEFEPTT